MTYRQLISSRLFVRINQFYPELVHSLAEHF